ncbi:transposable element Tcb2 transposase [Trichonephila clavipes]|nr:transposable element Tcb2 transposase [Trichonephila clavipes]
MIVVKASEAVQMVSKPQLAVRKVLLCIWWEWKGIIYYELLLYDRTPNSDPYCPQLDCLKLAINQKWPESVNRKEAWRVVGRLEGSQTQAEVAQAIGVSQNVISRIWNRFLETGSAGRRPEEHRTRTTTPNEDRYLVLMTRRHRNMNAILLQQHLRSATGTTVSTQTVRNRLHGVGMYARRPISRLSVHPDNRRIFIWRDRGSRNNSAFMHESVRFDGEGVLVYGGISIDGRTDLYIIRDGPLTARRYWDDILRPIVVP